MKNWLITVVIFQSNLWPLIDELTSPVFLKAEMIEFDDQEPVIKNGILDTSSCSINAVKDNVIAGPSTFYSQRNANRETLDDF